WLRRSTHVVALLDARTIRCALRPLPNAVSECMWPTARTFTTVSSSDEAASENESEKDATAKPVKLDHVRKLVVGLGNPGEKFAKTRHNIGFMAIEHFLNSYAHQALGKKVQLQHEARVHGDVARFCLQFQQHADDPKVRHDVDDLISRSSQRRKDKTLEEGVPHEHVNVALLLPDTFMNRSGTAVRAFMNSHHWRLKKNPLSLNRHDELLVVTDDVALPFGTCRFKVKGGPGGQNGVRDIIKCTGTERFARLRIGIGAPEWFMSGNSGAPAGTAMDRFVLGRFYPHEADDLPDLLEYTTELLRLYLHRGVAQASTLANGMDLDMVIMARPAPPPPVVLTQRDLPRVLASVVAGVAIACVLAFYVDDYVSRGHRDDHFYYPYVGWFLLTYEFLMIASRYLGHGTYILFDALWGCNIAMTLVVLAVFFSKPYLVGVAMAVVSGDQLCWYIDALAYLVTGKFPVGVIKYLTYPENRSFSKQFFASHHIWFLPLCLWLTAGHGGMHVASFPGACVMTGFLAAYCRAVSPFEVKVPEEDHVVYMNINGAFEFWRDIHIPVVHALDHRHPLLYLPYLTIMGNLVANGVPHLVLLIISWMIN
ncbi:TPA: hypothetical protein N0F65_008281, partial [Lagenidium giganteum]